MTASRPSPSRSSPPRRGVTTKTQALIPARMGALFPDHVAEELALSSLLPDGSSIISLGGVRREVSF